MDGGIYTSERCAICGSRMLDNHRDAVCCPNAKHSRSQRALNLIVRFGRRIYRRFTDYELASRFLTGLRYKTDEGSFDSRDYEPKNPLGFSNLVEKYLLIKSETIKASSLAKVKCDLRKAQDWFENQNVKEIGYGNLEDFFVGLSGLSGKSKFNIRANLHAFFAWLVKRKEIKRDQMPEFPEIRYELGYRKTIDSATQSAILEEIERITHGNSRIHIAIGWLCTYIHLRPGELLNILEEDVDYDRGIVIVRDHKTAYQTRQPKIIPLLDSDLEQLRKLPRGFPRMHLFRRDRSGGGRLQGTPFGKHLLWNVWKQACSNLGVRGVDLYGGTRHSSAQALRETLSPEGIRRLTGHTTNKAFERYYRVDVAELRAGYARTRKSCTTDAPPKKRSTT